MTDMHNFEMIDMATAVEVEVQIDNTGKLWINLNGKCLLRVGKVERFSMNDFLNKPKRAYRSVQVRK